MSIFISYRRNDTADVTGRVYDRLAGHFGSARVFKDVDSIPLGVDFRERLTEAVARCTVLVAVIGARWLDARDEAGRRRLDDPDDFVRIEIENALKAGIPVVPLLVGGTPMPRPEELPPGLRPLAYRNASVLRPDPDFHRDMDRVQRALEEDFRLAPASRAPAAPAPVRPRAAPSPPRGWLGSLFAGREFRCLYCDRVGTLVDDPDDPAMLRCGAVIDPEYEKKCPFRILRRLVGLPCASFAVFGPRGAGKTLWVLELWAGLLNGRGLRDIDLTPARCGDTDLRLLEDYVRYRRELMDMATQPEFPAEAVYLEGRTKGWWRTSSFLVSLFDYKGGEIAETLAGVARRHALARRRKGYVLFLDPSEPPAPEDRYRLPLLFQAIGEDSRASGHAGNLPLAVCLSKIDLLRDGPGAALVQELGRSTDAGPPLEVMRRRHEACLEFTRAHYEGVDVASWLQRISGGNYRFFPVTQQGLDPEGRAQPFGVYEPLLWLLHVTRYHRLPG